MEGRIDDLIEAGWGVLDPDFDLIAFHHWRRRAFHCLSDMLGPDHVYTRHFEIVVRQGGKTDLLAASGILSAAQEQMTCDGLKPSEAHGCLKSASPFTEAIRGAIRR
jgi:hypothetical protein